MIELIKAWCEHPVGAPLLFLFISLTGMLWIMVAFQGLRTCIEVYQNAKVIITKLESDVINKGIGLGLVKENE